MEETEVLKRARRVEGHRESLDRRRPREEGGPRHDARVDEARAAVFLHGLIDLPCGKDPEGVHHGYPLGPTWYGQKGTRDHLTRRGLGAGDDEARRRGP